MRRFFHNYGGLIGIIVQFLILGAAYVFLGDFLNQTNYGFLFYLKIAVLVAIIISFIALFCVCLDAALSKKKPRPRWIRIISGIYVCICIVAVIILRVAL